MNESQHPDHVVLNAYMRQPDAEKFRDVSLHLLHCQQCRDELDQSSRIKRYIASLDEAPVLEKSQYIVDEFLAHVGDEPQKQQLRQRILEDPVLLKSTLFSLAHQATHSLPGDEIAAPKQRNSSNWMQSLRESLQWQAPTWATVGVISMLTLVVTLVLLQNGGSARYSDDRISIASYQDNDLIRFYPREQLPGIGFFSGAQQSSTPFRNMQLSINRSQQLELLWTPVEKALGYELSLFRFAHGEKKLLKSFKTDNTGVSYQLAGDDFNRRFEWVLNGHTEDDRTFFASGGFVVHQNSGGG